MKSTHGLIPTVGYDLPATRPVYALEGSIAVTGSLVQWLRDSLEMISTAAADRDAGQLGPRQRRLLHRPRVLRAVRAALARGRPRRHGRAHVVRHAGHLARAVLEATGWQTRDVVDAMNADSGLPVTTLKVDGGMTANNLLMQFIADVLDVPVERPMVSEAVSLGAAYAAGLAVGYWPDIEVLARATGTAPRCGARDGPGGADAGTGELGPGGRPELRLGASRGPLRLLRGPDAASSPVRATNSASRSGTTSRASASSPGSA